MIDTSALWLLLPLLPVLAFSGGRPSAPPPPPPAPDTGEAETEAAKVRADIRRRRGRQSTILTSPSGAKLGTNMEKLAGVATTQSPTGP